MTRAPYDYGIHGPDEVRRMLPDEDPDFLNIRTGGNVTYMRKRRWGWIVAAAVVAIIAGVLL